MRTFAIFSCCQPKLQSQKLQLDSFMDHTTCCNYKAVFSHYLSNAIWKNDIKEIPNFNFSQYTIILLLLLRNIMLICYEKLLIKN